MKRHQQPPPHEDRRLHEIAYCLGNGLHKLVPTNGIGWPAYTKYGVMNSDHSDYHEPSAQEYLSVLLWIRWDAYKRQWVSCITVKDGDDFMLQRWMEFTYENWCQQLDLYNSITEFDRHTMEYLAMEGFG